MILHVDRAWFLEAAQHYLRAAPEVTDWGALAALAGVVCGQSEASRAAWGGTAGWSSGRCPD